MGSHRVITLTVPTDRAGPVRCTSIALGCLVGWGAPMSRSFSQNWWSGMCGMSPAAQPNHTLIRVSQLCPTVGQARVLAALCQCQNLRNKGQRSRSHFLLMSQPHGWWPHSPWLHVCRQQSGPPSPPIIQWLSFVMAIHVGKWKMHAFTNHNNSSSMNCLHFLKLREALVSLFWFGRNTNGWQSRRQACFLHQVLTAGFLLTLSCATYCMGPLLAGGWTGWSPDMPSKLSAVLWTFHNKTEDQCS